jgi:hypothetical protein
LGAVLGRGPAAAIGVSAEGRNLYRAKPSLRLERLRPAVV